MGTAICGPEDKTAVSGNPPSLGIDEENAPEISRGPALLLDPACVNGRDNKERKE
jgi:hypothetical protein